MRGYKEYYTPIKFVDDKFEDLESATIKIDLVPYMIPALTEAALVRGYAVSVSDRIVTISK